jgi:extracellular elastinolytic metalloproteinase
VPDFVTGEYVMNSTAGIRRYPYSTSAKTNPLRYSSVKALTEVHDVGEVWANMLHNVYAALVESHGFDVAARTTPESTAGNAIFLHLFIDSLALQPCSLTCKAVII